MSNDEQISVKVSADATQVKEGMGQASDATQKAMEAMTAAVSSMTAVMEKQTKAVVEAFGSMEKQVKKTGDETKSSLDTMLSTLNGFAKTAQGHLAHVAEAFEKIKGSLMAFAAVAAGGAALKKVIDDTNAWNLEAGKLSKQLGITTEQASVYMVAMHKLGIEADTLASASMKVAVQIMKGGEGFEKLGVKVKDASGNMRPAVDIIAETNEKIKGIHGTIVRDQAGVSTYGKAWESVKPLLKLTSEQMEEAAAKAKQLGLVVGSDGVAASKAYKENTREVGLALEALEINLGNALLPAFTEATEAMSRVAASTVGVLKPAFELMASAVGNVIDVVSDLVGAIKDTLTHAAEALGSIVHTVFGTQIPGDVDIVSSTIKGLEITCVIASGIIKDAIEGIGTAFDVVLGFVKTFANVADKALHLDWSGVKSAWDNGLKEIDAVVLKHADKVVKIQEDAKKKIDDIVFGTAPKRIKTGEEGGKDPDLTKLGKDKQDPGRTPQWEAELAALKDAKEKEAAVEGHFREMSLQEEADFWHKKLSQADLTTNEKLAVQKKYYALEAQVRKEAFAAEIETLTASKDAMGKNYQARIEVAKHVYDEIAAAYGKESKEAAKAYGDILKERKALADQIAKIAQLQAEAEAKARATHVEAEYKAAKAELEMIGASDQQKLALEREYLDHKHEMQIQALQYRLIDPSMDPEEYARIKAQMKEIDAQYAAEKKQLDTKDQAAQLSPLMNIMNGAQQSFASAIDGMLSKTKTLQQGLASIWKGITASITGEISKILAQKVAMFAKDKLIAMGFIQTEAAKAGAGAASSQAAIPVVGPAMALASMATTLAAVMGLSSLLPSAEGGFDIPSGVNPLTQLHEKEMVLPAEHAETIRNLGGGAGGGGDTHFHVHALDVRDFEGFLKRGGADVLVKSLNERRRNGAIR